VVFDFFMCTSQRHETNINDHKIFRANNSEMDDIEDTEMEIRLNKSRDTKRKSKDGKSLDFITLNMFISQIHKLFKTNCKI